MTRSVNLPAFETELVDGGLAVTTSQSSADLIVAVGFAAAGTSRGELNGQLQYPYEPVPIKKGADADYLYGYASNGSTLSRAVHELIGGGATRVSAFNLGKWGEATYIDPKTDISYPVFDSAQVSGETVYTINKANYYRVLGDAYEQLKDYMSADIIYPADAWAFDAVGVETTSASGHPTNFAYQLAFACYEMSMQNHECDGVINVTPSTSPTLSGVSAYVGSEPVHADSGNEDYDFITTNGTGLLGEPYMVGAASGTVANASILPGFFASNFEVDAVEYGLPPVIESEIATDRDGYAVDIGKYISIVAEAPIYSNGAYANLGESTYEGCGAAVYAALTSVLDPHRAPTGKKLSGLSGLKYRKSLRQLDLLDGGTPRYDNDEGSNVKYVTFKIYNNSIVVTDAPTAALPSSSYARLQVHRIIKSVAKVTRSICTPYIGEPNSEAIRSSLQTALDKAYKKMVGTALKSYTFTVDASTLDQTLGRLKVNLTVVPNFEIRKISFTVNMKSSL